MKHMQKRWKLGGWDFMLTLGQTFGIGLFTSGSWMGFRCNGVDLMLGPLCITVQPPIPRWLSNELAKEKAAVRGGD